MRWSRQEQDAVNTRFKQKVKVTLSGRLQSVERASLFKSKLVPALQTPPCSHLPRFVHRFLRFLALTRLRWVGVCIAWYKSETNEANKGELLPETMIPVHECWMERLEDQVSAAKAVSGLAAQLEKVGRSHECAKLKFPKFSLASIQVDPRPCFAEDVSCVEALKQFLPDSLLQLLPGWEHSRSSCKFEGKEKLVKRIIYSACGLIVQLCLIAGASCLVGHVSSEENLAIEGVLQELHWASYLSTSQWDAHVMWVFFPAFQPFPLVPGLRSPEASSLTAGSCPDSANLWGLWQFGGMWMKMNGKWEWWNHLKPHYETCFKVAALFQPVDSPSFEGSSSCWPCCGQLSQEEGRGTFWAGGWWE